MFHSSDVTISLYDINARFSSQLLRREAVVHSRRACRAYLGELSSFVRARLGDQLQLPLPQLEAGAEDSGRQQLEASLAARGWAAVDWSTRRLSRPQLSAAMEAAATLHAAGLAFRLSSRRSVEAAHPRLVQDVFTSSGAKELVARHLDSYLHCLAAVPGAASVVAKLRRLQPTVFRQLVALRRPRDELGARWIQQQ